MDRRNRHLPLLALVCLLVACTGAGHKAVDGSRFRGPGYTLPTPSGWEAQRGGMGADLLLLSPSEAAEDDFRENIAVVLEHLPPGMDRAAYLAANRSAMATMFTGYELVAEDGIEIDGRAVDRLRYRFTMGELNLDNDVYLVVEDGAAYTITCSMLAGGSRERFAATMEAVLRDFALDP